MAALPVIRINTDATIRRESIPEDDDCVIIDDFLQDPHGVVEFAAENAGQFSRMEAGYPGLLIRADGSAMTDIYRFIRFQMTKQFPFLRGNLKLSTFLSMVTFRPEELSALQRMCHTDPAPDPGRTPYAALLYLFENEELGGTSFFNYRKKYELLKEV